MNLDGKTILITGSTDGVGRRVAERLGAAGATVLVHGRDRGRGQALVDEIDKAGPGHARFYQADFASLDGVRRLADAVTRDHKRLDVLINNAGLGSGPPGHARATSAEGAPSRSRSSQLRGAPVASGRSSVSGRSNGIAAPWVVGQSRDATSRPDSPTRCHSGRTFSALAAMYVTPLTPRSPRR